MKLQRTMTSEQMFEKLKTLASNNKLQMSKSQLASQLGYTSSGATGFSNNLKKLLNQKLIEIIPKDNIPLGSKTGRVGKLLDIIISPNISIQQTKQVVTPNKQSLDDMPLNQRLEYLFDVILKLSTNNILKISKQKLFEQTEYKSFFDFSNEFSLLCKSKKVKILTRGETRTDMSIFEIEPLEQEKEEIKINSNIQKNITNEVASNIKEKEIIIDDNIENNNIVNDITNNINNNIDTENKLLEIDNLFMDFTNKYKKVKQQLLEKEKQLIEKDKLITDLNLKLSNIQSVDVYKETIAELNMEMEQLRLLNRKWMQQAIQYKEMLYQR